MTVWYRYVDALEEAPFDTPEDEVIGRSYDGDVMVVRIAIQRYAVIRKTPCGVWLSLSYGRKKWVGKSGRRRWAYPTKALALDSLRVRKLHQIGHCERAMHRARRTLELIPDVDTGE